MDRRNGKTDRTPVPNRHAGGDRRKYDEVTTLVELDATDDLTETDLLASLLVIRALREKLLEDERRYIAAARRKKVTWARLADALELRSRQAAERRYLQLRTDIDELNGSALTQQERIECARDQRDRLAERAWAVNNASEIRELAERLLNVPDLQDRADRSASAQRTHETAVRSAEQAGMPLPEKAAGTAWPSRLRDAFDADAALQEAPAVPRCLRPQSRPPEGDTGRQRDPSALRTPGKRREPRQRRPLRPRRPRPRHHRPDRAEAVTSDRCFAFGSCCRE
ncbi:hypothetical protein [Streptomyces sp. NPDC059460]|uniref:hypothetical protein n=1 Tax=Streptomyces sp. NPDC059460 TaxID=3346840 RepID=UPI0036BCBD98